MSDPSNPRVPWPATRLDKVLERIRAIEEKPCSDATRSERGYDDLKAEAEQLRIAG